MARTNGIDRRRAIVIVVAALKAVRQMNMLWLSVIHIRKIETMRAVILLAVALSAGSLFAEGQVIWQEGGVSIRDSTATPFGIDIVPDGSGGAILLWADDRWYPTTQEALYAQRIDSSGAKVWPDSAVSVCEPPELSDYPKSAADGAGGVVTCWEAAGTIGFRAQRLDGSGTRLWGDSSVLVFDTTTIELDLLYWEMCSDGRGGCVVVWVMNYYNDDSIVLRAQYMDSLGQLVWGARGRRIAREVALYGSVGAVGLGSQGFVFTWISDNGEICAKRLDAAGNEVWTASLCGGVSVLGYPVIVATDGGVLVCWTDMRNGDWDVYAQKLDPAGNSLWARNGVPVCRAEGQQGGPIFGADEWVRAAGLADGSALVAYSDRGRGRTAVSCQRLSADGHVMWDSTGAEAGRIVDRDTQFGRMRFGLVPDTAEGAIVTWPRYLPSDTSQIWAQHLNAAGSPCWGAGVCVSEFAQYNELPFLRTTTDAKCGVIGCWLDMRFDWPHWSVYAQRYGDGPTGLAESHATLPRAHQMICPNPVRSGFALEWPAGLDRSVAIFDASGRRVTTLLGSLSREGDMRADWNGRNSQGRRVPPGVYVCTLADGTGTLSQKVALTR